MLVRELLPLLTGVDRIVDLTPEALDLTRHLMVPEGLHHDRLDLAAAAAAEIGPGDLLVAAIGPDQADPDDLTPVLAALPAGARLLLLSTWPAIELPYHRLLDPLGGASLQVTDAVPLSQVSRHGLHVALLATKVTELLPQRAYLIDLDGEPNAEGKDGLPTRLRMANEHVLGEIVARPARRLLREQAIELAELRAGLAELRIERDALAHRMTVSDKEKAKLRKQMAALQASASFRVGRTFVDGAKHPARAVVSVPKNLTQIWKSHRAGSGPASAEAANASARPTHRTVTFAVPGLPAPGRRLSMTAPVAFLVPRKLAKDGLAGYEPPAVACFLAALDTAGPGAVYDVGANVGLYAGLAGALTDRQVVAFEPAPSLAGAARRFALDNGLGFRTESLALGDRTGTATLYLSDSSDTSNSLAAGFRQSSKQVQVPTETLDAYVERTGLVPAVIKVDTETTEPEVLFGSADTIKVHRPWILCEVLAGRVEKRLTEALAPHGYHWYHITDEVPYRPTTTIQGDTTHQYLMWLFAPEAPDEAFWATVRERKEQIAKATA